MSGCDGGTRYKTNFISQTTPLKCSGVILGITYALLRVNLMDCPKTKFVLILV